MISHMSMQMMLARRARLSPDEEAEVVAHLDECAACHALAREYAGQVALLRSLRREAPSGSLRQNLLAEIDRRVATSETQQRRWARRQEHTVRRPLLPARSPGATLRALRWPALLVAPVLALALLFFGWPFSRPAESGARAAALLQATVGATLRVPYSSTATVRYLATDTWLFPQWQIAHVERVRSRVRDATHYRIEATVLKPALDSGSVTTIQNGTEYVQYDTRTNTAGRQTVSQSMIDLTLPLAGSDGAAPASLFDPAQSIQHYLNFIGGNSALDHVKHYARIAGQGRLLGRAVTVVAYAPVEIGTRCVGSNPATQKCNVPDDSGSARVWIDDATHLILKYTIDLEQRYQLPGRYSYQVTALRFGRAAARPDLTGRLPVRARVPHYSKSTAGGRGTVFPHIPVVPRGFLQPRTLPSELAYASTDMSYVRTVTLNRITGLDIEFSQQKRHVSISPAYHHYVVVLERMQVHGLPAAMRTGARVRAGVCTVWTGMTSTGLRTAAFARGHVSVLATTDTLSSHELVAYVGRSFCGRGHVAG